MGIGHFKTLMLMLGLTALLLFVGELAGGRYGIMMGLGFAVFSNLIAYFFSDKIVLTMYRARPAGENEQPELYRTVHDLAQAANIPMPKLYIIPGEMANAFATGRDPKHAAVAVTEGIMKILSPRELRGVLGHELSHVFNRDILISTIAAIVAGAIYSVARMAQWGAMFGGGSRDNEERGGHPAALLLVAIMAPIAAMLIQMAVSRSREYEADRAGADLTGDPLALAEALKKIHHAVKIFPWQPNPTTAHLFIANPLTARTMLSLFSTHPPMEKRVERLEAMADKMGPTAHRAARGPDLPSLIY